MSDICVFLDRELYPTEMFVNVHGDTRAGMLNPAYWGKVKAVKSFKYYQQRSNTSYVFSVCETSMCVCVPECVHEGALVCACMWRSKVDVRRLSQSLSALLF